MLGFVPRGNLHTSQSSGAGSGIGSESGVACAVAGAEFIARVGEFARAGVLGEVLGACFITIERYVSAMLRPEDVDGVEVVSRLEERTNGTGLRRIPEVNGRWVSGGRLKSSYSSSDAMVGKAARVERRK